MTPEKPVPVKPAFEEYLEPEVIWWPWWVAVEYYRRKTLHVVTPEFLMTKGRRKNGFSFGVYANAPTKKTSVDRASFMDWVHGRGGRKK